MKSARLMLYDNHNKLHLGNPYLKIILAEQSNLLYIFDLVVQQYQHESEKDIFLFHQKKQIILSVTYCLIILIWFIIFRPMVKEIKFYLGELKKNESALEHKVKERTFELDLSNKNLLKEIDEHRKTSQQLKLLSSAIEQTDDTVIITDTEGKISYVNPSFEHKTGFGNKEALGKKPSIVKSGLHSNEFYKNLWNTINDGQVYKGVIANKNKSGKLYWEEKTISPIKIDSDYFNYFVATGKDVTEKIKTEKELEENEKKYRELVEGMNEGLAHVDFTGEILFVNESFSKIMGYSKEEITGRKIYDLVFAGDKELFIEKLKDRKAGIKENYEITVPRKDGKPIWLYVNSSPFYKENAVAGVMATFMDITKRKEAQLALDELYRFNQTLLQTIPLGLQVIDRSGTILFANDALKKLSPGEITGKKCWEVFCDDKMPCYDCIAGKTFVKGRLVQFEKERMFEDKTVRIYQMGIDFQNTVAALEVFVDITQLKETEEKLQAKNKELNNFFWRSSHDMRSPIANIKGLIYLYRGKIDVPEAVECMMYLERSTEQLDRVITELVKIGTIYNSPLDLSKIDVSALVEDIKTGVIHRDDFQGMKFHIDLNIINTFISDKSLLTSVLQNLVDNALKYKNPKAANPFVSVKISDFKKGLQIAVLDNGQGMSLEVQKRAFEMFYRGNLGSKGTGLGLYTVKNSIEKLGGTIKVESTEQVGTKFILYIPTIGSLEV